MSRLPICLFVVLAMVAPACGGVDGATTSDGGTSDAGAVTQDASGHSDAVELSEDTAVDDASTGVEDSMMADDDATTVVDDATTVVEDTAVSVDDAVVALDIVEGLDVTANSPPVAVDDLVKVLAGASEIIKVLLNDSDPDGDPLGIKSVTQGAYGVVAIVVGGGVEPDTLEYTTLSADYVGLDTITYTVHDGQGNEDTATVTLNVLAPLPEPTLIITSPVDGDIIEGDTVTIEFEVVGCTFTTPSISALGCHGHKYLNGSKWWALDGTAGHGHYAPVPFTVFPLTDGSHTVELVLIRNDGSDAPWIPGVSASVTFEVVGGAWETPKVEGALHRVEYAGETKELMLGTEKGLYETSAGSTELALVFGGPDFVSLAQDPFASDTYHASGHWADAGFANWGFTTSSDGGESWEQISLSGLVSFDHLAMSPDQQGLVAAASDGQLHVSADAGETWEVYDWAKPVTALAVAGAAGPVLLVGSSDGLERVVLPEVTASLLVTADVTGLDRVPDGFAYGTATGGVVVCNGGLGDCAEVVGPSTDAVTDVLVDPDYPDVLHVLTAASELYRSVDGGLDWELLVVGN